MCYCYVQNVPWRMQTCYRWPLTTCVFYHSQGALLVLDQMPGADAFSCACCGVFVRQNLRHWILDRNPTRYVAVISRAFRWSVLIQSKSCMVFKIHPSVYTSKHPTFYINFYMHKWKGNTGKVCHFELLVQWICTASIRCLPQRETMAVGFESVAELPRCAGHKPQDYHFLMLTSQSLLGCRYDSLKS